MAHVWTQIPFAVVLMMAALSTINPETLEAAAIDCRSATKRFRHVIFPEVKSMIVVLLVYNALVAFTSYDLVYAMTGGGPGTATTLLSFQIWRESFSMYDFGAGSARRLHRRPHLGAADCRDHEGVALRSLRKQVMMAGRLHPVLTFIFAALILIFAGGPVLLSLYGSVVPDRILLSPDQSILTAGPSFETYRYVFTGQLPESYLQESANRAMISDAARQVPRALLNSSLNALAVMALNLILGAPAAFVFARYLFPGKRISFLYLILSPLVPAVALVTPIYMTMQWLGLVGTSVGIILVHTARALPFTVLILSVFFRKIPPEIFEAAMLDHCSRFQTFWRVAVPLALPSIGATGLFAFMLSYSEFMFSMVLSGTAATRPVSVVMAALARNTDVSWSLLNTGIFLAIVPDARPRDPRLALRRRGPAERRGQGIGDDGRGRRRRHPRPLKQRPATARQHATAGPYSPVLEVDARRLVVISGQVAVDLAGRVLGKHDRGADGARRSATAPASSRAPAARSRTCRRASGASTPSSRRAWTRGR